jgi:hypothetical protein
LLPKLVTDLESGDYYPQNRAARFISSSRLDWMTGPTLPGPDQEHLAGLLVLAASGGAFGAKDAASRSSMAEWTTEALIGALWACLTSGGDRIGPALDRLRPVLSAAVIAGKLEEVLDGATARVLTAGLSPVSELSAAEEKRWLSEEPTGLPPDGQKRWVGFLEDLFAAIPRI